MKLLAYTITAVGLGLLLTLAGCSSYRPQAPIVVKDRGPERDMDVSHIPDAIPRAEPRTRAGNTSPYSVLGRTYYVDLETKHYSERGRASWYGEKFHGRPTANGELYDMYGMTAAHKTLPIPSFVRVTNLANGKTVVVRINDRGPFHEDRILDLTYAAAKKLDFHRQGTAEVQVELIDTAAEKVVASADLGRATPTGEPVAPTPANSAGYAIPANTYLQLGAFSNESSALSLKSKVSSFTEYPVKILRVNNPALYKVLIGPIKDNWELVTLQQKLLEAQLADAHVVRL